MALTQNTALRTALAQAWGDRFNAGTVEIRTAANGAGTLLASITLPNPAFATASAGAISKTGTWSDSSANASGTATHGRIISSGGTEIADFTVGTSGADMIIDNASIVLGGVVTVSTFTYTAPAS
jgi:hypothetical protein